MAAFEPNTGLLVNCYAHYYPLDSKVIFDAKLVADNHIKPVLFYVVLARNNFIASLTTYIGFYTSFM